MTYTGESASEWAVRWASLAIARRELSSLPTLASFRQSLSPLLLVTIVVFLAFSTDAQNTPKRSDFPFLQAMHELDAEEEMLEHLRGWENSVDGPENGLSDSESETFELLVFLIVLSNVGDDGRLDGEGVEQDVALSWPRFRFVSIDDDGQMVLGEGAIDDPAYFMVCFVVDSLVPGFFGRRW